MDDAAHVATDEAALPRLQEATRARHEALEQSPHLARLISSHLSLGEYTYVLQRMLGFHDVSEWRLAAVSDRLPLDTSARKKAHLAARDLQHLGMTPDSISSLPRCASVPTISNVDAALGLLYVVEGSTLGGRIILRHLGTSIRLTADAGASFFAGYGSATGAMFREVCGAIEERVAETGKLNLLVRTAQDTFDALLQWMELEKGK